MIFKLQHKVPVDVGKTEEDPCAKELVVVGKSFWKK